MTGSTGSVPGLRPVAGASPSAAPAEAPGSPRASASLSSPEGLEPRSSHSPAAPSRHHSKRASLPTHEFGSSSARTFDSFHSTRQDFPPGGSPVESPGSSPGSSTLLPPASLGRSDRFPAVVELAGLDLAEPAPDVVIDIDPPAAPPTPREQLAGALDRLEFAAPPGPLRDAQLALEAQYVDWGAGVAERRAAVFGEGRYSIGQDQGKDFGRALLPAAYDFARQFISSSSRSPVAGAVITELAPRYTEIAGQRINIGEFSNGWDASLVGGAVGGVTAHAVDSTLLSAMDREARKANLPQLKPADLKALIPDPGEVQLTLVEGRKHYWRLSDDPQADAEMGQAFAEGRPTRAQLQEEADNQRKALGAVQNALEAKDWGLFAQPIVTGAFNALRRVVMPAASLLQPGPVFVGSVIASGTAGAVTKLGLGLLKPAAQAQVDDLVGGRQTVDLFASQRPDASQPAAGWSDIGALPGHAAAAIKEGAALGTHFVAGPWRDSGTWTPSWAASKARIADVMRSVTSNTLASVLSVATGPLVASVAREGLNAPLPDEAKDSSANLLQQAATSATNDFVWQAGKEALKSSAFDLPASLKRWREG